MRPTRARLLALACIFLLGGSVSPAFAALHIDFDGDGTVDTVSLVSGERPYIRIAFPGAREPLVLPLKERVSSVVAIDVDHDGLTDLAATKRRGLILWKNHGKGRFTPWHRAVRPRVPMPSTVASAGQGLHPHHTTDRIDIEGAGGQDEHGSAPAAARSVWQPTLAATDLFLPRSSLPDDVSSLASGSRAPPSRSN